MITLRCDNCEKTITVPDDQAGAKIRCPHCNDVNVVPARVAGPDRAETEGLPPADGPEKSVMRIHASVIRAHPFQALTVLLLVVAGIAVFVGTGFVTPPAIAGAVLAGLAALYLVYRKIEKIAASIEVTNKRVIERKGFFSRFVSEVRHVDIRNVQVRQSFVDRLLGIGHIGVSTSGDDGFEIQLSDVPHPERIRRVLDLYRTL